MASESHARTMEEEQKKKNPQIKPQAVPSSSSNLRQEPSIESALAQLSNFPPSGLAPASSHVTNAPAATASAGLYQPTFQLAQTQQQPSANNVIDPNALAALLTANPALLQQVIAQQQAQQAQQAAAALLAAAGATTGAAPFTHNLIPQYLQGNSVSASLNGTPGYSPALIESLPPLLAAAITTVPQPIQIHQPLPQQLVFAPTQQQQQQQPVVSPPVGTTFQDMTLQDRKGFDPTFIAQYNGINPNYPGVRVLNSDPPVFAVDNFLSPLECQFLVTVASDSFGPAPVVGKGAGEVSPSRTSSTCYLAREDLPDYLRKVSALTGKPIEHCELPQVGRYFPSQQYLQHFDAFDTTNEDGRRFASNGGQRTITVLVYLNDVMRGGCTRFPALNLDVQPRQGMALVFFPATIDGYLDKRALHAAMPAIDTKFVSQVWIRQRNYNGQPSKRLTSIMGAPFQPSEQQQVPQAVPAPLTLGAATTTTTTTNHNNNSGSMIPNPLAANNLPATF